MLLTNETRSTGEDAREVAVGWTCSPREHAHETCIQKQKHHANLVDRKCEHGPFNSWPGSSTVYATIYCLFLSLSDCRNQSSFRKNQEVKNEAGRERGSKPRNATEGNSIELRLCEM